jgi:hypothetical protein
MKILAASIISLLAGISLAMLSGDRIPSEPVVNAMVPGGTSSPDEAEPSIESRLLALEQALIAEQGARQLLEEELFYWMDTANIVGDNAEPGSGPSGQVRANSQSRNSERRAASRRDNSRERRSERLMAVGFDAATAEWILTRESELQMESLRARYQANLDGEAVDTYRQTVDFRDQMRQQLGDADFEQYLTANGRSLHVSVGSVLDSSPAQSAGLHVGDQIVNYGGARVYNMYDLSQEILQGAPGERVVVDFLRDGVPMQLVLPRGPVGITGGR